MPHVVFPPILPCLKLLKFFPVGVRVGGSTGFVYRRAHRNFRRGYIFGVEGRERVVIVVVQLQIVRIERGE
jgi:hypothetical protein